MLDAMSCWTVDWSAISAVATATATLVALWAATKDAFARNTRRKRAVKVAQTLMDEELTHLKALASSNGASMMRLVSSRTPQTEREYAMNLLTVPSLVAYLDNKQYIDEDVTLGIADVVALATIYRNSLAEGNVGRLLRTRGACSTHYEAMSLAVDKLRRLLSQKATRC